MQKKIIALAIAGLASTAAFAQSNVTVYGIADVGYVGVDADGTKFQHNINSGVLSTSRIGFKGVEDLGNGLKALFTLEYGLAVDQNAGVGTGAAAARQQFVGLTGGFGTVVAGRLQTAGLDFTTAGSALGGSSALGAVNQVNGKVGGLNDALISQVSRANNAIAYISPSFGGLTMAVNHARLTETAATDDLSDNSATLVAANYANGPITAGLVYSKLSVEKKNEGVINNANPLLNAAKVNNSDVNEWGVRAGYDLGVAKLQAAYQRMNQDAVGSDLTHNKYVLSATVPVGAKAAVIAEYAAAKVDNGAASDDKNKAYTLAATYSLSKRTTAYAGYVATRPDAAKSDVNTYGAGVRHSF